MAELVIFILLCIFCPALVLIGLACGAVYLAWRLLVNIAQSFTGD